MHEQANKSSAKRVTIFSAAMYVAAALFIGYLALGIWPSLLFSLGFLGGFILWRWMPAGTSWKNIRIPYFITLALFILHKIEENKMNFFPALSKITGVPVPPLASAPAILLLVIASAWLLIPFLVSRNGAFGYFLAWTFFASMGIVELAHFVFPFFTNESYGYFPGMWSVMPMAPVAWWGMHRLWKSDRKDNKRLLFNAQNNDRAIVRMFILIIILIIIFVLIIIFLALMR